MKSKKRIILIGILLTFLVCITGCNNKEQDKEAETKANDILNNTTETIQTEKETNNETNKKKKLVVYFSKTGENYNVGNVEVGNTAMMASYIKEYLNADSFEIVPVNSYSDNYKEATDEAKKEQNENARPAIKNKLNNLEEYDTIFLGYPIWWRDLPMIVYTFLEEYHFDGLTIIPFNTHEGSGASGTYTTIKNKLPNSQVITNGLALKGSTARTNTGKEETLKWLKELGY